MATLYDKPAQVQPEIYSYAYARLLLIGGMLASSEAGWQKLHE